MTWLKSNWRWGMFNMSAACITVYVLTQGSTGWSTMATFDSGLESGKWAIRFLLACLMMTPLNTYLGWKSAIKLRKSAGLWAFGFASTHVLFYIREAKLDWLTIDMPFYFMLGLVGMVILGLLAITSNRWAMKQLGRNWKRLHRLVYFSGIAVVTHSMLAAMLSKKVFARDPQASMELRIYAALLFVLLAVRIPVIHTLLKQMPVLLRSGQKSGSPAGIPGGTELLPRVYGRESGVSIKPTFIIPNELPDPFGRTSGRSDDYTHSRITQSLPREEVEVQ